MVACLRRNRAPTRSVGRVGRWRSDTPLQHDYPLAREGMSPRRSGSTPQNAAQREAPVDDRATSRSADGAIVQVIGLVGGVASGKSLVARQLVELGAGWLDADRAGHEVLELKEVKQAIRDRWGDEVVDADGSLSRVAIGRRVFGNAPSAAGERRFLEQLTHPRIGEFLGARRRPWKRREKKPWCSMLPCWSRRAGANFATRLFSWRPPVRYDYREPEGAVGASRNLPPAKPRRNLWT